MKKTIIIVLAVVSAFGLGFSVAKPHAARMTGISEYIAYEVSSLTEIEVENPMGEAVGSIHDFVIDSNEHIVFALLT